MGRCARRWPIPSQLADDVNPQPEETRIVPREGERQKNVVVITLESHRATSTLPDTGQPVTPVLDALADSSIMPERGYSVLPHTSKALTAVYCGIAPPLDMLNSEADSGSPRPLPPGALRGAGLRHGLLPDRDRALRASPGPPRTSASTTSWPSTP